MSSLPNRLARASRRPIAGSSTPGPPRCPIVSVPVTMQPSVSFGEVTELTRAPRPGLTSLDARGYDVLPDGRFVSISGETPVMPLTGEVNVVINWTEELKRLAPLK